MFSLYFFNKTSTKERTKMYRRIRDLREDSDLLQRDLAEYLQCTQVC